MTNSPSTWVSTSVLPCACDQRHQLRHVLAQELAAGVDPLAEAVQLGLDAPADPVARFEQQEVDAGLAQLMRRRQAGEAGADDDDVGPFDPSLNSRP